jgi:hypothetical protein
LERQGDFVKIIVTGFITVDNNELSTVEKNPFSQIFIGSFSTQTFYEKDDFFSGDEFFNYKLIGYTSLFDRDLVPNYKLITMNEVSSLYKAFYLGSVEMIDALIDAGLNINLIEKTHYNQPSKILKKYNHDNLIKYLEKTDKKKLDCKVVY